MIMIEATQAMSTGPRCLGSGRLSGPSRQVRMARSSRFSTRYEAKKMARTILAISPGWKPTPPMLTQILWAVDLAADAGDQRQHQQAQADQRERVAVALEDAGPAHEQQDGHEGGDADRGPQRLESGQLRVAVRLGQAGHHHVAEPVEEGGHRQQDRIGVGGQPAHDEVGEEHEAQHDQQERPDVEGDLLLGAEAGQRVGGADDDHHHHQESQFGVAPAGPHPRQFPAMVLVVPIVGRVVGVVDWVARSWSWRLAR